MSGIRQSVSAVRERRNYVRHSSGGDVFCRGERAADGVMAQALDISQGGASLACEKLFPVGQRLRLEFCRDGNETASVVAAGIVRWVETDGNAWKIGLQFDALLTLEQLVRLLRP